MSRRFCVSRSSDCSLTRAVTVSLLADLVRLQSLDLDVVFFTQKVLLAEIVGPPQGVTGASNVASVLSVSVILSVCLVRCLSSCLSFYLSISF